MAYAIASIQSNGLPALVTVESFADAKKEAYRAAGRRAKAVFITNTESGETRCYSNTTKPFFQKQQ